MFGYVRPQPLELRVREYRYYRGVYCGLCRAQGRCTGQCSRMTLSYDYVFVSLLRLALENGNPTDTDGAAVVRFERRRCLPHPLRPRLSLVGGAATDHVARCAALLNFYKLCDDRHDEKPFSRAGLRARLLYGPLRAQYRRAARADAALAEQLQEAMQRFSQAEQEKLGSADTPAAAFGEVVALLLSYGVQESDRATIARHVGRHVGKWLYFADALEDYGEDVRQGRYNPLRELYGTDTLQPQQKESVATAMAHELMQADDALALLDFDDERCGKDLRALLAHMLRVALPGVTRSLAQGTYAHERRGRSAAESVRQMDATLSDE